MEILNLRVGKNLNLNYSCNDVVWNTLDENMIATGATNGAVVLWNLSKNTRAKQEHVFSDHQRTVHKVINCFDFYMHHRLVQTNNDILWQRRKHMQNHTLDHNKNLA